MKFLRNLFFIGLILLSFSSTVFAEVKNVGDYRINDSYNEVIILNYYGSDQNLTIPSYLEGKPVTKLESSAFSHNYGLHSIQLPSTIKTIGAYTFSHCEQLTNITLNEGLEYIGINAFEYSNLSSITIPSTCYYMDSSFVYCNNLRDITINNGAGTKYTAAAFAQLNNLNSITIPASFKISSGLFFNDKNLKRVTIENGATTIYKKAFDDCDNLEYIYIPESVTILEDNIFDSNCISKLVVHGVSGSAAEYYCKKNGITFIADNSSTSGDHSYNYSNNNSVIYSTHIQNIGWQNFTSTGLTSGTSGMSLRLEGIKISLNGQCVPGGIKYRTHVQDYGWQNYVENGQMSGTEGQSKRLEAIQIELTGDMANYCDVYYRVHAQDVGWMGWAKNGEPAGTAGHSKRLEAIQIVVQSKKRSENRHYIDYPNPASLTNTAFIGN